MSGMFRSNPAVAQAITTAAITQKPLALPSATGAAAGAAPMAMPDASKPVPDIAGAISARQRAGGTLAGSVAQAGGLYAGQKLGG